jgi:hypothetical protein
MKVNNKQQSSLSIRVLPRSCQQQAQLHPTRGAAAAVAAAAALLGALQMEGTQQAAEHRVDQQCSSNHCSTCTCE